MFKETTEAPGIVLVSLLLTLNIFGMLFKCFLAEFEHVNAVLNTLLPQSKLDYTFPNQIGVLEHLR